MDLQVRHRIEGALDAHRNPVVTYSSPRPWQVRAVAPGASTEPTQPNRDPSLILWTVYSELSEDVPAERDRVVMDGVDYEVEGRPSDWTRGPWPNLVAGVVTELKRWEG